MKSFNLFFLAPLFFLLLCTACDSNEAALKEAQSADVPITGRWKLTQLTPGWTGKIVDAATLPYEEYYEFNTDGTFKKYRSNGLETKGTYVTRELPKDEMEVALTFEPATDLDVQSLQFSCSGSLTLRWSKSEGLVEDNLACDGPKNFYRKVEPNGND